MKYKNQCDCCKKYGSFTAHNFAENGLFGFIGFSKKDLNELGLNHLDNDSIRCENCLMVDSKRGK
tara:strand:- start:369 stop:563 length:195 start_codon:yes stop_codon:yes gene_type:complete